MRLPAKPRARKQRHQLEQPEIGGIQHAPDPLAPLYTWRPPAPKQEGPAARHIRQRSSGLIANDVLHALLALCVHRLEKVNEFAAWQFVQEYSGFQLSYATVTGSGDDTGAWATAFFARAYEQKIIRSKKDRPKEPDALRAYAIMQYGRALRGLQAAGRICDRLPERERGLAMAAALRLLLDGIGTPGEEAAFGADLIRRALEQSPRHVAREVVELAVPIKLASRLKKDRPLMSHPRFRWLEDHIPPAP